MRCSRGPRLSVPAEHWPLIIALLARHFVTTLKDTLDPRISLALVMESAIATSKIDPTWAPQTLPGQK